MNRLRRNILFISLVFLFLTTGSNVLATSPANHAAASVNALAWQYSNSNSSYNKYKYKRKKKSYNRYKRRSTYNRSRYRNRYKRRSTYKRRRYIRKRTYRRTYTRKRYVPKRTYRRTYTRKRYYRKPVRRTTYRRPTRRTTFRRTTTRRSAWSNNRVRYWNPRTRRWEWKRKRSGLIGRPYRPHRRPITARKRYRVWDARTRRYKWVYRAPSSIPARRRTGRWVTKRVRVYDYRTRRYKYSYKRVFVTGAVVGSTVSSGRTGPVSYNRSSGSSRPGSSTPKRTGRGQSVPHCLSVYRKGDRTYFKNTCGYEISVAYCSTNRKISGKYCNHGRNSWNPYYSHMMNLKPGKEQYKWKAGNLRYGTCKGYINSWSAKGKFSSTRTGGYTCTNL